MSKDIASVIVECLNDEKYKYNLQHVKELYKNKAQIHDDNKTKLLRLVEHTINTRSDILRTHVELYKNRFITYGTFEANEVDATYKYSFKSNSIYYSIKNEDVEKGVLRLIEDIESLDLKWSIRKPNKYTSDHYFFIEWDHWPTH